jgi:hypothetical protein
MREEKQVAIGVAGGDVEFRFDAILFPQGFLVYEIFVSTWILAANLDLG